MTSYSKYTCNNVKIQRKRRKKRKKKKKKLLTYLLTSPSDPWPMRPIPFSWPIWPMTHRPIPCSEPNSKSTTRFPTSHRWTVYVTPPISPKGGTKREFAVLSVKFNFCQKKSATKFLYVKTYSGIVAATSFPYKALCNGPQMDCEWRPAPSTYK